MALAQGKVRLLLYVGAHASVNLHWYLHAQNAVGNWVGYVGWRPRNNGVGAHRFGRPPPVIMTIPISTKFTNQHANPKPRWSILPPLIAEESGYGVLAARPLGMRPPSPSANPAAPTCSNMLQHRQPLVTCHPAPISAHKATTYLPRTWALGITEN
ncbi:hypothetical protein BKA56DRAFT_617264 [Ilyonectria sp. MPI-CAGE-AT-0026]|nr:hypothetical protein BKA56DRAFT_617264 [Ilyonectria sp. MPI-CAGE-AT-0026]